MKQVEEMSASIERGNTAIRDVKMDVAKYMQETEQYRQKVESLQLEMATTEATIRESDLAIRAVKVNWKQ